MNCKKKNILFPKKNTHTSISPTYQSSNTILYTTINLLNMLSGVRQQSKLFTKSISQVSKRYNSSHNHHHHEPESKPLEITFAKIFGVAAIAGGLLVYKNKDKTDKPLFSSKFFDEITTGERSHLRDEQYERKYKIGYLRTFDRDNGGIGQQLNKVSAYELPNNNLIPAHSPFGNQFGVGIKTNELGPRRERAQRFAPLQQPAEN